ncbi:MAG: hypothetical protein ACRCZI_02325 [Cetobacterium sp.]
MGFESNPLDKEEALTKSRHNNYVLHQFDQALLAPTTSASVKLSNAAHPGRADSPARSDHVHSLILDQQVGTNDNEAVNQYIDLVASPPTWTAGINNFGAYSSSYPFTNTSPRPQTLIILAKSTFHCLYKAGVSYTVGMQLDVDGTPLTYESILNCASDITYTVHSLGTYIVTVVPNVTVTFKVRYKINPGSLTLTPYSARSQFDLISI